MLNGIDSFISSKWSKLYGRKRLIIEGLTCGNITCHKHDMFRKYKENHYICICGFEIKGEFNILSEHKTVLYCGASKCHLNKKKMEPDCLKCPSIKERF